MAKTPPPTPSPDDFLTIHINRHMLSKFIRWLTGGVAFAGGLVGIYGYIWPR